MSQASNIIPTSEHRFLPERDVAEITGLSLSKLQQDRHYRKGIPYSKVGKLVRYSLQDVLNYMEAHKVEHN